MRILMILGLMAVAPCAVIYAVIVVSSMSYPHPDPSDQRMMIGSHLLFMAGVFILNNRVVKRNGVPVRPQRSDWLTIYATYLFSVEILLLILSILAVVNPDRVEALATTREIRESLLASVLSGAAAVCAAAMLNWRRWGAWGCGLIGVAQVAFAWWSPLWGLQVAGVLAVMAPLTLWNRKLFTRPDSG